MYALCWFSAWSWIGSEEKMNKVKCLAANILAATSLAFAIEAIASPPILAQMAQIVGLGAATCKQFTADIESEPLIQRDYLAWAQGFVSGIILGRPAGAIPT